MRFVPNILGLPGACPEKRTSRKLPKQLTIRPMAQPFAQFPLPARVNVFIPPQIRINDMPPGPDKQIAIAKFLEANWDCETFAYADNIYTEMTAAQRLLWKRAVKRPHRNGYDVWMKEALYLLLDGYAPPDRPSVSGGWSKKKALEGLTYSVSPAFEADNPPALPLIPPDPIPPVFDSVVMTPVPRSASDIWILQTRWKTAPTTYIPAGWEIVAKKRRASSDQPWTREFQIWPTLPEPIHLFAPYFHGYICCQLRFPPLPNYTLCVSKWHKGTWRALNFAGVLRKVDKPFPWPNPAKQKKI